MLPVITAVIPTGHDGKPVVNGKLAPCDLASVYLPGLGLGNLHPQTVRAWNMLATICKAETGVTLTASSLGDTYRSLASQEQVFAQRYRSTYNPVTCVLSDTRTWNGRKYYRLRNVAPVATPGTSNHGYGLAIDCAVWNGKTIVGITSNADAWKWLQANAVSFGFSWEMQSEPWHLRHVYGNDVAQRVKDCEAWFAAAAA